jgi:4-amino-4-deoxy-L-arabinose transferase-like glycosyltransferase
VQIVFAYVLFPALSSPLELSRDPEGLGRLARNWADGKGFTFHEGNPPTTGRGPGYPLLLAGLSLVFGDLFSAAVLVQCLIGSLVCVTIYAIAKRLFGARVATVSALAGAVHPLLFWHGPRLRYQPLLTLLLALGILCALRARESRSLRDAALLGLCFGGATLVNQIVLLLLPVLFAVFFLQGAPWATLGKQFAVALLTLIATIAPWTARNYQVAGAFIPVHSGGVTQFVTGSYEFEHYHEAPMQASKLGRLGAAYAANLLGHKGVGEYDELAPATDRALLPYALAYLRNEPEKLLVKTVVQIPRFWYLSETPARSWLLAAIQAPFLLLTLVSAAYLLRTGHRALPLLATVAYFNLLYAAIVVEGRYSTPVVPYIIILGVAGARLLFDAVRARARPVETARKVEHLS